MANVQTPHKEVVVKTPLTPPQEAKQTYCIVCRWLYVTKGAQEHMHSMLHHRELEAVLGKDSRHECHACKVSYMSLYDYAQHISTTQHHVKLQILISKKVKALSLHKTLSPETIAMILKRNKSLKKEEKKAIKKKKKKLKQEAGQKQAKKLKGSTKKKNPSKAIKQEKMCQMKMGKSQQRQETRHTGSNNAVVQNKENKVSGLQRPLHHTESTLQNQSTRFSCVSGNPAGPTWHHPHVRDQFPQSTHHPMYNDNCSVNSQFTVNVKHSKREVFLKTPHKAHRDATETPQQITRPGVGHFDCDSWQYSSATDNEFTTDCLPQTGALIFDHDQHESTRSSHPPQESSPGSAQPASDSDAAPIRDVDVSAMLRQIRRALGVREPCRADREARRQNNKAGVGVAVCTTTQQPEAEVEQPAGSSEPNITSARKVRIAHKPDKAQRRDTERMNKLLSLSEMKRRKAVGMPRFGIQLSKRPTDQESLPLIEDYDLPLSEGFHWESFQDGPLGPHLSLPLPPPLQTNTTHADCETETQPDSQVQEPLEQPDPAQESCSYQTEVHVKVEPNVQPENEGLRENHVSKRKLNEDVDISRKEPSSKKKKTKSNKDQDQMDQLLTVSLREEELSHSLQDLDKSLIQARNALTAAYAEVQRLLLLRQQCTAEVNSLRAKRIEILQGMQEGYSGASNVTERATTSSAGAAATLQLPAFPSSSAFMPSSSPQPPATSPALSVTHSLQTPLALSTLSVKKEMCHLPVAGQAAHFTSTVPCNSDAPQVPLNQPVSLFPSGLFPSLLLTQSHLVTPTPPPPAAAELPKAQSSTSARTLPSPESPPRQQQETGQGLKEGVQTVVLETTSEEESARSVSKDQRTEAADKSVPEREKHASAADDKGNESDDSLEMITASNQEVIHIDESDNDDSSEPDSNVPEPPQQSVSVEFSFASTQTFQQSEDDRKKKPVTDASAPAEFVEEEEPSVGSFLNHTGPVHGLQVHDGVLYTCSGDNTARAYSLVTREYLGVFEGHTNKVNCLLVSSVPDMPTRLYTGSSDQTIRCYSIKTKKCLEQIVLPDRVLCLYVAWKILYAGLANGSVASYDIKTLKQLDVFECHGPRGVSCLGTAQEGARRLLLVGSYDTTISVRDAKSGLLLRSLEGHTKTVLCMKVVNDLVFSGSSDTSVHAHNIHTGELVRIYKGHGHAVTSIVILGKVMVTACLDKLVRIYELQSHDRLQVYGGHSDMVMCMAVHKSVIYTGCYDGSVQAVRLNLMKNYRCWWQNCSLIFGMSDHLVQHLTGDHTNPKLQMCKCRWRGCNAFFSTQQAVRQELPEHMQSHAENDSQVQP